MKAIEVLLDFANNFPQLFKIIEISTVVLK